MATSVKSLIESFPHPSIPSIQGQPTYESITEVTRLLNANAASVHTDLGGGSHGHLVLTVSPTVPPTLSATPFIVPNNPGPTPIIPVNSNAQETNVITQRHHEELHIWCEYINVDAALKQQLIKAVNPLYLRTLQHRHTGFSNSTTKNLIEDLLQSYGNITPNDLSHNDTVFRKPYNPNQLVETFYSQIEDAMDYANAGHSAYTAAQVVTNAYSQISNTGMFPESCREWRCKPEAEKTWARFKVHFTEAHQDWRLTQGTTQTAGYHGANNAMDSFVNDTADAFTNFATATASDRQMLADLTASNKALTELIARKDTEIGNLKKKTNGRSGNGNNNRNQNNNNNNNNNNNRDSTKRRYDNTNYCWTHGYDIHNTHTSQSCNFPHDGHQRDTTHADTKDGSNDNKDKVM